MKPKKRQHLRMLSRKAAARECVYPPRMVVASCATPSWRKVMWVKLPGKWPQSVSRSFKAVMLHLSFRSPSPPQIPKSMQSCPTSFGLTMISSLFPSWGITYLLTWKHLNTSFATLRVFLPLPFLPTFPKIHPFVSVELPARWNTPWSPMPKWRRLTALPVN